jgi:hypothetical protein
VVVVVTDARVEVLVGPPGLPVGLDDLRFLADHARRYMDSVRAGSDPEATPESNAVVMGFAMGTFETVAWVVGLTDMRPVLGGSTAERTVSLLLGERQAALELLGSLPPGHVQKFYLQGVLDGLGFALGEVPEYAWWAPLSEEYRALYGARDMYGYRLKTA